MAKKRKKTKISGRKYKHAKAIRTLAVLGSAIALVFHIVAFIEILIASASNIQGMVAALLGVVVDIIILGSMGVLKHDFKIKMTWFSLLALGIADAILTAMSYVGYGQYAALGVLFTIVAAFIALIDRL